MHTLCLADIDGKRMTSWPLTMACIADIRRPMEYFK